MRPWNMSRGALPAWNVYGAQIFALVDELDDIKTSICEGCCSSLKVLSYCPIEFLWEIVRWGDEIDWSSEGSNVSRLVKSLRVEPPIALPPAITTVSKLILRRRDKLTSRSLSQSDLVKCPDSWNPKQRTVLAWGAGVPCSELAPSCPSK